VTSPPQMAAELESARLRLLGSRIT